MIARYRLEPHTAMAQRASDSSRVDPVTEMLDRIAHNPNVLAGRATVRGLLVSVAHIVNLVANGMTPAEIIEDIPELNAEDI